MTIARILRGVAGLLPAVLLFWPASGMAADELSGGDTAWILTATALVLFMTLPGLALFYAGLVRSSSVLSVLMHCFAICCVASIVWLAVGVQSWPTATAAPRTLISAGWTRHSWPESGLIRFRDRSRKPCFFAFQMTFAIITPALIVGAYPERVTFPAVIFFSAVWLIIVYAPVTHWVWGGGWLAEMGVMDFAGGIVVHVTAGVSALVFAKMLGGRRGFPDQVRPPHSPGMTMTGAAMLWVGWFGFNAGSALAADGNAGMAMVVTHISAAAASLTWAAVEWIKFGKPSLIGIVTGTIAGLATITPASGFVGSVGALIIGVAAGIVCQWMTTWIKQKIKIDDSLDVFAVHGVGGALGTILVSFLALSTFPRPWPRGGHDRRKATWRSSHRCPCSRALVGGRHLRDRQDRERHVRTAGPRRGRN